MVALQGKTHNLLLKGMVFPNKFENNSDCEIFNPGRRTVSRRPAIGKMGIFEIKVIEVFLC